MTALEAKFKVSYAGEVEYEVGPDVYTVRYFANPHPHMGWKPETIENHKARVGTVMHGSSYKWHRFPPAEVVALFPGFVGCRYAADYTVEYDGQKPALIPDPDVSYYVTCPAAVALR